MASTPPATPDTINPQSPAEVPAQPAPVEAPPPGQEPISVPDDGGDSIEPGRTPDEVPPEVSH